MYASSSLSFLSSESSSIALLGSARVSSSAATAAAAAFAVSFIAFLYAVTRAFEDTKDIKAIGVENKGDSVLD